MEQSLMHQWGKSHIFLPLNYNAHLSLAIYGSYDGKKKKSIFYLNIYYFIMLVVVVVIYYNRYIILFYCLYYFIVLNVKIKLLILGIL